MAITIMGTGTSNLGANVVGSEWIERVFVKALRSKLLFTILGRQSTMPEGVSKVVRWQFFDNPSAVSAATEGTDTTDSTDYTTTTAEATLQEFNGFTKFSRFLTKTAVSGTIEEFTIGAGYQAGLTMDTQCQVALAAATNTNDVGTALAAEDLRVAASELSTNDAEYHPSTPGSQFFCFIGTPAAASDMLGEGAPAWFQAKSSDYQAALVTPFRDTPASAAIYDVMVKRSTNIQTSGGDDVMYLMAKDSFGVAKLDTDTLNPRVVPTMPEENVASPTRTFGTIGWWILFASIIIDNNRLVEILADT